ncbi:MAG: hypothetical protein V1834_01835 [Candidatus Micrarchaeota archaeon]
MLALFVSGFTAEEFAASYVNDGEQFTIHPMTFEGDSYVIVKINDLESVILTEKAGDFVEVTDDATLNALIPAYLREKYAAGQLTPTVDQIKANLDKILGNSTQCKTGVDRFIKNAKYSSPYWYITLTRTDYPAEYAAYAACLNLKEEFGNTTLALQEARTEFEIAINESNAQGAYAALAKAKTALPAHKAVYEQLAEHHATATSSFPFIFNTGVRNPNSCQLDADLQTAFNELTVLLESGEYSDEAELAARIKSETQTRGMLALSKRLGLSRSDSINKLNEKITSLELNFSNASGMELNGLRNKYAELQQLLDSVSAGTGDSEALAEEFDEKLSEIEQDVGNYERVYLDYFTVVDTLQRAQVESAAAIERLGSTDQRLVDLQSRLQNVTIELRQREDNLRNNVNMSAVEFKELSDQAQEIGLSISSLVPKENELDFVMIGGILIIVIAVLGGIIYFLKFRKRQPPTEMDYSDLQTPKYGPAITIETGEDNKKSGQRTL